MHYRLYVTAVVASLCFASPASAQESNVPAPAQAVVIDSTDVRAAQPSILDKPSVAVRRTDVVAPAAAPLPASGQNLGEAKAQMIVGGAAFVAGALIDNDVGTVLMLGGAVISLYGLWNYLK